MSVSERVALKEKSNSSNNNGGESNRKHNQHYQKPQEKDLSSNSIDNIVTVTDTREISASELAILKEKKNSKNGGEGSSYKKPVDAKDYYENNSDSFLKRYKIIEKIGEGSYSEVLKCQHRQDGTIVACKRLKHIYKSWADVNNISEIATLRTLERHVNILQMIEIHYDETLGKVSLVFELMDVNLYELIKDRKRLLPESRVRTIMFQLFRALRHLHKLGIFHRDIKPENILIKTKTDQLKLGDLGSVRGLYSRAPYTEYISTRWYRSPECLLTAGHYSHKMDIWAAGCVFYEVLTLRPLFPGSSELDQINRINNILGPPPMKLLETFQKQAEMEKDSYRGQSQLNRRQQIQKILDGYTSRYIPVADNSKKLSNKSIKTNGKNIIEYHFAGKEGTGLEKLLASNVSREAKEIIKACLAYDPELRPTAHKVIHLSYFYELRESYSKASEKVPSKPVITICGECPVEPCGKIDLRTLGDNKVRYRRGHQIKVPPLQQPSKQAIPGKKSSGSKVDGNNNYTKDSASPNDNSLASCSRISNLTESKHSIHSTNKLSRKLSNTSNASTVYKVQQPVVVNKAIKYPSNLPPDINNNFVKDISSSSMKQDGKAKFMKESGSSLKQEITNKFVKDTTSIPREITNNYVIKDSSSSSSKLEISSHGVFKSKERPHSGARMSPGKLITAAAERIRKELQENEMKRTDRLKPTVLKDEDSYSSDDNMVMPVPAKKKVTERDRSEVFKVQKDKDTDRFSKPPDKMFSKPAVPVSTKNQSVETTGTVDLMTLGDIKIRYRRAQPPQQQQPAKANKQPSKQTMPVKKPSPLKPELINTYMKTASLVKSGIHHNQNYMKNSPYIKPELYNCYRKNSSSVKQEINKGYMKSSSTLDKIETRNPPERRSFSNAAAEQIRKELRDTQRKRSERMKSTIRDDVFCSSEEEVSQPLRKNVGLERGEYKSYNNRDSYSKSFEKVVPPTKSCAESVVEQGVDLRVLGSNKIRYQRGKPMKVSQEPSKQIIAPLPVKKTSKTKQEVNISYIKNSTLKPEVSSTFNMKSSSFIKPDGNNNYSKNSPSSVKPELTIGSMYYHQKSSAFKPEGYPGYQKTNKLDKNDGTNWGVRNSLGRQHSYNNAAAEQIRKDLRETHRRRSERMKSTMRDEVFCSSDDDVVISMRKKFDSLISERARKLSESLKSNIVSNAASNTNEFRNRCESDDELGVPQRNSYSKNISASEKSKKYARRELRARMAESLTMNSRFTSMHWRIPDNLHRSQDETPMMLDSGDSLLLSGYNDRALGDKKSTYTQTTDKVAYPQEVSYQQTNQPMQSSSRIYPFSRQAQTNNRHGQIYTPPGNKPVYQPPSVGTMLHERKFRYNHNIQVPRLSNSSSQNYTNTNYTARGRNLKDVDGSGSDLKNRLRQRH